MWPPNQLYPTETPRSDGSLNLPYLAAAVERAGIESDILDSSVGTEGLSLQETFYNPVMQENGLTRIGMSFDQIAQHVVSKGYDIVAINSNFTPQTSMVFQTAAAIRKADPEIKIITGGVNARAMKERFLRTGFFDGLCITEGELIIPRMIGALRSGEGLESIPGIAFRDNGRVVTNPVDPDTCFPKHLDDLAMPAWEKLPIERYDEIGSGADHGFDVTGKERERSGSVMTSRGCPFKCMYCHIWDEKEGSESGGIGVYRMHSMERVLAEINRLQELGVKTIYFEDDSLLVDKYRVKGIFDALSERGLSIRDVNGVNLVHLFDRNAPKIKGWYQVDHRHLEILKEGGFDQIVFPLESGSLRVQQKYATNKVLLDRMDLVKLARAMTDIGIKAPVNAMIGFPDETEEEMRMTLDLAKKIREEGGAPYVDIFCPIPFPGTGLYRMAVDGGYLDRDFDPDIMNWKNPVMRNTTVSPQRIQEIVRDGLVEVNSAKYLASRKASHLDDN